MASGPATAAATAAWSLVSTVLSARGPRRSRVAIMAPFRGAIAAGISRRPPIGRPCLIQPGPLLIIELRQAAQQL